MIFCPFSVFFYSKTAFYSKKTRNKQILPVSREC
nr:MAG TPA: hypothetical protein [Caudoviricetes sp.]